MVEDTGDIVVQPTIVLHDEKADEIQTPDTIAFDRALLTAAQDGNQHDLKSFLARDIVVKDGQWSSATPAGGVVETINLPEDIFNANKMMLRKVSGFAGFRATTVIRLQVNTNRFQQGRLTMHYFPQNDQLVRQYANCLSNLYYITQLPRVDFDAATDSEVTFRVPYVNNLLYYGTRDRTGFNGSVRLFAYQPLQAVSGELTADYTIFCHFEDIKLEFPTVPGGIFVPQSGFSSSIRRKGDPVLKEQQGFGIKPISSTIGAVADAATSLARIPLISSVAGTAAWALNATKQVAMAFGFSKPQNCSSSTIVIQKPMAFNMNATGADNGYNYGIEDDNHIDHLPGFAGSDEDEMHFMRMLKIPTWTQTFPWNDSVTRGSLLVSFAIKPESFQIVAPITVNTVATFLHTTSPMAYLSFFFEYWRGSICLRFKIVKTEFHSGRIMAAFTPGTGGQGATFGNTAYTHREVYDLRDTTEFTFTCPWVATVPWISSGTSSGSLDLWVVNDLRHPDTVEPTINFIVEVFGGSDLEFSSPKPFYMVPYDAVNSGNPTLTNNDPNTTAEPQADWGYEPQIGEVSIGQLSESTTVARDPGSIGTSKIVDDQNSSSRFCIGEKVQSWRQLLKRSSLLWAPGPTQWIQFRPYMLPCWINTGVAITTDVEIGVDYLGLIAPMFAYMRGGLRFKMYASTADGPGNTVITRQTTGITPWIVSGNEGEHRYQSPAVIVSTPEVYPCVEFTVPFYHSRHAALTTTELVNSPARYWWPQKPSSMIEGHSMPGTFDNVRLMRSISEDFSLGFFLCTQPVIDQQPGLLGNNIPYA